MKRYFTKLIDIAKLVKVENDIPSSDSQREEPVEVTSTDNARLHSPLFTERGLMFELLQPLLIVGLSLYEPHSSTNLQQD